MTKKLLFVFILLISFEAIAQDKKWSAEANYTIIPDEGFGETNNLTDLGLKYRFGDFSFLELGVSINVGFAREKASDGLTTLYDTKSYFIQPRIFADFQIPGVERLRPSLGLGYSIVNTDFESDAIAWNETNGGFNLNLGVSYDIFKRFFVQVQYDFINLQVNDEILFNGETLRSNHTDRVNNLKIGVGFRF